MEGEFCECRPLGFVIGLPFALLSLVFCPVGAIIWLLGSIMSCLCPCWKGCGELSNVGVSLVKFPIRVLRWFIEKIPC
ncbi:signaling peptide TAXIMIN 2-like [Vigna unguiculata]|uniref:signaling peptide TAXIMIN 2-like n=1 Tax=Vigna unguiculata TaxID=3917 RepID=UPI001015E092|nr:signaling peptide TAXIMIN 2-like [Vigna unguiculata]